MVQFFSGAWFMRYAAAALISFLLSAAAVADVVHLKDGRKIEGKVTDLGDKVKIERAFGSITVDKAEVLRIEAREFKEKAPSSAPAPTPSRPRYRVRMIGTLTSIDLNCVLFHPSGWGADSPVIRGPIPGPREGDTALRLEWYGRKSDRTVEEEAADFRKEIEAEHPGATFTEGASFSQGGRPTVQFEASYEEKGRKMTVLVQLMKNGDMLALFRFAADEEAFRKRWHEVNMMLRSIKWFRRAELTDEQKERFLNLYEEGYRKMRAGRPQEALDLYKECEGMVPQIGAVQTAKGHAYLGLKDYRNAVVAVQKALQFEPDNVIALWQLAMSYYHWGKEEDAIRTFKRVMEVDPENDEAFLNCGILYANKEKWHDARDAWKRGAQKNPDSVELHLHWGQAAERCDRTSEAVQAYEEVLRLQPANGEAKARIEALKNRK